MVPSKSQERNKVEVTMKTFQFGFEPNTIRVRRGDLVVIHIISQDITHGFAIQEYGINVQTPPGQATTVQFIADKPGTFTMFCTVFCGTGHPNHKGSLVVD